MSAFDALVRPALVRIGAPDGGYDPHGDQFWGTGFFIAPRLGADVRPCRGRGGWRGVEEGAGRRHHLAGRQDRAPVRRHGRARPAPARGPGVRPRALGLPRRRPRARARHAQGLLRPARRAASGPDHRGGSARLVPGDRGAGHPPGARPAERRRRPRPRHEGGAARRGLFRRPRRRRPPGRRDRLQQGTLVRPGRPRPPHRPAPSARRARGRVLGRGPARPRPSPPRPLPPVAGRRIRLDARAGAARRPAPAEPEAAHPAAGTARRPAPADQPRRDHGPGRPGEGLDQEHHDPGRVRGRPAHVERGRGPAVRAARARPQRSR
ncbi:hypothetical protein STANM309S_02384 [Streptomyces tanashiensis]